MPSKTKKQKITLTIFLIIGIITLKSIESKEVSGGRTQIETISSGMLPLKITTGSGNANKLNFKKFYRSSHEEERKEHLKVHKETKASVQYYTKIKNSLIADLADQDPKIFKPDDPRYWNIADKRGFFFVFFSIVYSLLFFWIFLARLAWGDCGGYKTMIIKPTKKQRYTALGIMAAGVVVFLICLSFNVYYGRYDNKMTRDLALSLLSENQNMMTTYNSIRNTIEKINSMKLNVRFSQVSLEKFKLGNFLEGKICYYIFFRLISFNIF